MDCNGDRRDLHNEGSLTMFCTPLTTSLATVVLSTQTVVHVYDRTQIVPGHLNPAKVETETQAYINARRTKGIWSDRIAKQNEKAIRAAITATSAGYSREGQLAVGVSAQGSLWESFIPNLGTAGGTVPFRVYFDGVHTLEEMDEPGPGRVRRDLYVGDKRSILSGPCELFVLTGCWSGLIERAEPIIRQGKKWQVVLIDGSYGSKVRCELLYDEQQPGRLVTATAYVKSQGQPDWSLRSTCEVVASRRKDGAWVPTEVVYRRFAGSDLCETDFLRLREEKKSQLKSVVDRLKPGQDVVDFRASAYATGDERTVVYEYTGKLPSIESLAEKLRTRNGAEEHAIVDWRWLILGLVSVGFALSLTRAARGGGSKLD